MNMSVGFNLFASIGSYGPMAAGPVAPVAAPGYSFGYGFVAGAYNFSAPSAYGAWGSYGPWQRTMAGPGVLAYQNMQLATGAMAVGSIADGSLEAATAALHWDNVVNGFQYGASSAKAGGEEHPTPPAVKDRVSRLFDGIVVEAKSPTTIFTTDERKAIMDDEKGGPLEGQHKMLIDLTTAAKKLLQSEDARARFMAADEALYDDSPSSDELLARRLLNILAHGAGDSDSATDSLIREFLGERVPRGDDKNRYQNEARAKAKELLRGEAADRIKQLYGYVKAMAKERGFTKQTVPAESVIALRVEKMGYDGTTANVIASVLKDVKPKDWDAVESRLRTGAEEAVKKRVGPEAQIQYRFQMAGMEILRALGFQDDADNGQRNDIYELAVPRKAKKPDYHDMAGFVAHAKQVKAELEGTDGKDPLTMEAVKKKHKDGKGFKK